jgi:hypothetical protein
MERKCLFAGGQPTPRNSPADTLGAMLGSAWIRLMKEGCCLANPAATVPIKIAAESAILDLVNMLMSPVTSCVVSVGLNRPSPKKTA